MDQNLIMDFLCYVLVYRQEKEKKERRIHFLLSLLCLKWELYLLCNRDVLTLLKCLNIPQRTLQTVLSSGFLLVWLC